MHIPVEHLSRVDLKKLANQFLNKCNPESLIPTPIDLIIEEKFNIDIVPSVGLKDILGNDGFVSWDFSTIHVDQNVYMNLNTRYRFSLAHELGHFWLHKKIYEIFDFSTIDEWKKIYLQIDDDDYWWLEFQANNFAGFVLTPDYALKSIYSEELEKIESQIKQVEEYGISRSEYLEHVINLLAAEASTESSIPAFTA